MRRSLDYVDPRTKFEKTFRGAGLAFGVLLGLNTVFLLVVANFTGDEAGTYADEQMFMNGFGIALAGVTVGISYALFSKQRWAAYVAFIVTVLLLATTVLTKLLTAVSDSANSFVGVGCGVVIVALLAIVQFNAIRVPRPYVFTPPPRPSPLAEPSLQPYSAGAAADATPRVPVRYPLGTAGITVLALCGLTVLGGITMAAIGLAGTLEPDEVEWVVVRDDVVGVQLEMPGPPRDVQEVADLSMRYIRTQQYAGLQHQVSITCIALEEGFLYSDEEAVSSLTVGIDYTKSTIESRGRFMGNDIEIFEIVLRHTNGFIEHKWVFHAITHMVTVIVIEPERDNDAVASRVNASLRYTR